MCGVAGLLSLKKKSLANPERIAKSILKLLDHRGPDSRGYWISKCKDVIICNTRLAVVDPKNKVSVPLKYENNFILSFNGEIYDYKIQKKKLAKNHNFFSIKTNLDSEILLHGLINNGKNFLKQIDGMWSLAFYDERKRMLLLSRDLLGEKHLFYTIKNDILIFSSEMNCLLSLISEKPDYDYSSIISSFQFRACQPGKTLIKNVFKLLPGHNLEVNKGLIKKYSHLEFETNQRIEQINSFSKFNSLIDLYDEEISKAVVSRVPSDTTFASTISGGIDSTLLNIYLNKNKKKPSFCLHGLSSKNSDGIEEFNLSKKTARNLEFKFEKFDMHNSDCVEIYMQQCSNSFDGIFCEGSIGFRQLAKFVNSKKLKVLMLSDGVDDFLSGYNSDIACYYLNNNKILSNLNFMKYLFKNPYVCQMLSIFNKNDFINWILSNDDRFSFRPVNAGSSIYDLNRIFNNNFMKNRNIDFGKINNNYENQISKFDFSQKMSLSYALNITPDYFNLRTDRASHFHSVEFRLPFQKKSLVELMLATPASSRFKYRKFGKRILRELLERHSNKKIAWKKKVGFYFPAWWNDDFKKKMKMKEVISESKVFELEIFKKGIKEKLLNKSNSRFFWFAYCLSMTDLKLRSGNFHINYTPL